AGAVRMAAENAERAGVGALARFEQRAVEELVAPDGPPGLVIVNPPYGARIGHKGPLLLLHRRLGDRLQAEFAGWRVGIVTADAELARATGLPFGKPGTPVLHGGIRVTLWQTGPLA